MASTMHLTLVLLCLVVSHAHGLSDDVLPLSDDSDVSLPSTAAAAPAPSPSTAAAAPAPSPSADTPASGLSLPVTQNVVAGLFEYTVLAGYGTPAQQLPMYFDVISGGSSGIRCKPCFSSRGPCDVGFDPSKSSSFRTLPCGSPDCDFSCSTGGSCSTTYQKTLVFGNGTIVMDTLTLSPSSSTTFENFVVECVHLDNIWYTDGEALGRIDLSPSRHSLLTRRLNSSPPGTAAFSYCLPADTDNHGFLTIAPALSDYSTHTGVKYVPLVTNPNGPNAWPNAWPNAYYVDLVAIAINGKDLLLPPALFMDNGTVISSRAMFTYLNQPIYAALRDEFRKAMAQYPPAPAFKNLDTCYNFTLTENIYLPNITFRFGNGETMDLDDSQFMYFPMNLTDGVTIGCLAFVAKPFRNYIGTQVQQTKEIVYDIRGGKVAFVPSRCGLR